MVDVVCWITIIFVYLNFRWIWSSGIINNFTLVYWGEHFERGIIFIAYIYNDIWRGIITYNILLIWIGIDGLRNFGIIKKPWTCNCVCLFLLEKYGSEIAFTIQYCRINFLLAVFKNIYDCIFFNFHYTSKTKQYELFLRHVHS